MGRARGTAAITLSKLNKHYGSLFHAVKGIDLDIADRVFISWSGRRAAASRRRCGYRGSRAPTRRHPFGSQVVNKVPSRDRGVAMVFESYALYPHKSVFENLGNPLSIAKVSRRLRSSAGSARPPRCSNSTVCCERGRGAVGRSAPARRDRARDRARAGGVPVRRAALQPRCQVACPDARRDQAPAAALGAPRRSM